MKHGRITLILLLLVGLVLVACGSDDDNSDRSDSDASTTDNGETQRLILATATSTEDSGLLDFILPVFESQFNADVDVVAVGTGQALALGSSGDADVVLVHARERELEFVESGNGTRRLDVMYNDFVIIGPSEDPAGIRGMTDIGAAFAQIASVEADFVSRGDDSGTHIREISLWESSELGTVPAASWYISAGQGMGAVINMSTELNAYTMTDRATFISRRAEGLQLELLVEGDPLLQNPYSVIPVNSAQHPNINEELANAFAVWLTSQETQELIASYTVEDEQLFFPNSARYQANESATEGLEGLIGG